MPFNGSGTFVPLSPPDFPALPFTTILASQFNNNLNDLFTSGLTNCMTRDGQSPPTANIPMAGFRLTGLGAASADTDAAQIQQTLATRGQVGAVDWNTRVTTGIFEATAASLATPATNFPPTSALGELIVIAQGALVDQVYKVANQTWMRQKITGVWSTWQSQTIGKNVLLNGGMQIWQDVLSLGAGTGSRYSADMFRANSVGTTYNVARGALGVSGITEIPEIPYYYNIAVTSVVGVSNFCNLIAFVEGVNNLAGKQVTISFYAFATTGIPVAVSLQQSFGTGGSPSAIVEVPLGKVTLTTTGFIRYSFTTTLPGITGKTLGSNGDDSLGIKVWFDAGSTFNTQASSLGQQSGNFSLTGFKLEEGPVATDFEIQDVSTELLKCQRYYIRTTATSSYGPLFWAATSVNAVAYLTVDKFPVTMRTTPTMVFGDVASTAFTAGITASIVGPQGVLISKTANAANNAAFYSVVYTADARF